MPNPLIAGFYAGASPPAGSGSILEAVYDLLNSDAVLVAEFDHAPDATPPRRKFWTTLAGRGTVAPYVVASLRGGPEPAFGFGDDYRRWSVVHFAVYALGIPEADRLGRMVYGRFEPKRSRPKLAWDGGAEMHSWASEGTVMAGNSPGREGSDLHRFDFDWHCLASITMGG